MIDADTHNAIEAALEAGARAREEYGAFAQDFMIVEECGELLTALARRERGRGTDDQVDEEIADVLLVLLGAMCPEVQRHLIAKTQRLSDRLDGFMLRRPNSE